MSAEHWQRDADRAGVRPRQRETEAESGRKAGRRKRSFAARLQAPPGRTESVTE